MSGASSGGDNRRRAMMSSENNSQRTPAVVQLQKVDMYILLGQVKHQFDFTANNNL